MDRSQGDWSPPRPQRPVAAGHVPSLPEHAPAPPVIPVRRVRKARFLLAALVCAVLAIVLGSLTAATFQDAHAPRGAVTRYFAALQSGNAAGALALASATPSGDYLTAVVLKQQLAIAPLSGVAVHAVQISGASATAAVSYRLGFSAGVKQVSDTVELVKHGSSWRLSRVAATISVSTGSAGTDRLSFAGRPLPTGRVTVFPGALPITSASPAVEVIGSPAALLARASQDVGVAVSMTDAAKAKLSTALTAALASCLNGSSTDPDCPVADDVRSIPGTLRGQVDGTGSSPLRVEFASSADGKVQLSENVSVTGSWKRWDFNNQAIGKTGVNDLELHATASVSDLTKIYWTSS